MKRTQPLHFILLLIASFLLFSCASNNFTVRKNFQPRVSIEPLTPETGDESLQKTKSVISSDSSDKQNQLLKEGKVYPKTQPKESLLEKVIKKTFPKKKEMFDRLFDSKRNLKKTQDPNLDGSQVAGLVVGIVAMCIAIASYLMILVMIGGSLYTGFIIGLVLAAVAIAMGFIGKRLPLGGISLAAGILGIIAIFVLLVFLVLIIVGVI